MTFPSSLSSHKITHLQTTITVPGDKSISHRVAILGGLATGTTHIDNFLCSQDCLNTLNAMIAMGAKCQVLEKNEQGAPISFTLTGCGGTLHAPQSGIIDCGNSGTGMRLLAGVVAAQEFATTLIGDDSLSSRPMGRILKPLSQMGADIAATGTLTGCAPLQTQQGKKNLHGIDYTLPMASAQVKSCVLLAGLFAQGTTIVHQPAITRDHTERLFTHFGIQCNTNNEGLDITLKGGQIPTANNLIVPGDISSAAFWLVAAAALHGSRLTLKHVGLNTTRTAIINVLLRMGADIYFDNTTDGSAGEPYGDIIVIGKKLTGTAITPEEVPNLIDEIPILAIAGALSTGIMELRHAKELRVKETDRVNTIATNLKAMGAYVEEYDDGLVITGGHPLHGTILDSFGDHRIAMSFLIAGLFAEGTTTLLNTGCIATSYPNFEADLAQALSQK